MSVMSESTSDLPKVPREDKGLYTFVKNNDSSITKAKILTGEEVKRIFQ